MKIHIGCGSVYLDGWRNIDVAGPKTFLASHRKDLVAKWKTTDDKYYARHQDKTQAKLRTGPLNQEYVCDAFGSFDNIPAQYWSCDELLARHVFEHLSLSEAHKALDQVDAIMKPGGILRLDVPDSKETLELYRKTGDAFYERALFGPRRDDRGYHLMPYTRDLLRSVVEEHGFLFEAEEPNIHFYPSFCLRFRKPEVLAPRDYVELPEIPDSWKVLDVGPGPYPLLRANAYLDRCVDNLKSLKEQGKEVIVGDLMSGLPEIPDKSFDAIWCSHVLEHMEEPSRIAATLSRIGKRGWLVVPSTFKEMMFFGEEREHLWQCLPNPKTGGPPIFIRNNECYMKALRDTEMQKITSRLYRTGPNRLEEARYARSWFYRNEQSLDVVHHWEGSLAITVID